MTTVTFNPENWINDTATAVINNNTVKVNGEVLTMEAETVVRDEDGNSKWDMHSITVNWEGQEFVTLIRFGGDARWTSNSDGLEREHSDPAILAAVMASNLI